MFWTVIIFLCHLITKLVGHYQAFTFFCRLLTIVFYKIKSFIIIDVTISHCLVVVVIIIINNNNFMRLLPLWESTFYYLSFWKGWSFSVYSSVMLNENHILPLLNTQTSDTLTKRRDKLLISPVYSGLLLIFLPCGGHHSIRKDPSLV